MNKYLDYTGLTTLVNKIKELIPTVFSGSGTNHSQGLVPDPGAAQGTTKYLREDGTWAVPEGGGVQSDWEQSDSTAGDYIKNKPTIPNIDIVKRLVFTGGYAYIHPTNTDDNGDFVFDGNWTIEVLHPLTANGFVKVTNASNTYEKFNKLVVPNGNYSLAYSATDGQDFFDYSIWYNVKTKTFTYGKKPVDSDPNWFEAFEDVPHYYYYWELGFEGLMGMQIVRKSSSSSNYSIYIPGIKREYIGEAVYMDNILPDSVSNYPIDLNRFVIYVLANRRDNTKLVFSEKLYRVTGFPTTNINIVGAGMDKTIFSQYDAETNEETSNYWDATFHSMYIKDCTIKNRGFEQYNTGNAIDKSATFENVKFWVTIGTPSRYLIFTSSTGFKLYIKNCILLNESESARLYAGIWTTNAEYVEITNTKIGDYFSRPCVNNSAHQALIDNVDVTNGITGICFTANRENPLENSIVQNCTVRFIDEECISFDSLGNNVDGNPLVCELSITDGEIVQDVSDSLVNKRLKLYCNARHLTGTHPNEQYEAYSIVENASLIKKMYIAFDEPAGDVFAGTVVKILDCGKESDGEEREWILVDTQLSFEDLELLEDTDITVTNNNYKVALVTSGFFNVRVSHNKCYGGKNAGIALYNAIYHCTVDSNYVSNCRIGSYLWASKTLATGVYNGACGNIITNNVFEGGDEYGFDFQKFDRVFGYYNIFSNNLILNNKGVRITYEKGLTYEGNSIIGPDAILDLSRNTWGANVVESSKFGTVFPIAPSPGQRFFKTDTSKEFMWDGTQWIDSTASDVSNKEDKLEIITQSSGTLLTAVVGNYYRFTYDVGTLDITLPTPTGSNAQSVLFFMTTGSSPAVTFTSNGNTIYKNDGFAIDASTTYEINALWNGGAWVINAVKYTV